MFNIQQSRWSIKSTSDTQRSVSKQEILRYLTIKGGYIELDCISNKFNPYTVYFILL